MEFSMQNSSCDFWGLVFGILSQLEHLAFFLIELSLVEYEALAFKPSLLCASAIYLARCTLQMTPTWTPLLCKHARYEVSQIRQMLKSYYFCSFLLHVYHYTANSKYFAGVVQRWCWSSIKLLERESWTLPMKNTQGPNSGGLQQWSHWTAFPFESLNLSSTSLLWTVMSWNLVI